MSDSLPKSPDDGFNYLMLSDVHLGSDIIPHLRPWALTSWLLQENEIDARLTALLDHYIAQRDQGRPWRLVLAGDFLDLVGVSISTQASLRTPPTAEEERHGMGSAADHVVQKVAAIVARHPAVFRALGRFVAAGNALVIVRGNHDIELYWRAAQRALVDAILACEPPRSRALLRTRIAIQPWFFAVDGLLYVEHGHEFDPMCSYGDPLVSTCQRDRRRIRWTPFSVLLRYVARPTRGLSSVSYGYVGMGAYVGLLIKLGVRGSVAIAGRYMRASYRLLGECLLNAGAAARSRAHAARAGLARFARRTGVHEDRLTRLRALYVPPAVQRLGFMLRSLYLDRVMCGLSGGLGFILAALLFAYVGLISAATSALSALLLITYALVGSGTNRSPQATMIHNAPHIAALFSARWVVMGHTHEPVLQPVSDSASYVNLGSWGEDDPPDERVTQRNHGGTFLLLRKHAGDFQAELMRWDELLGPLPALSTARNS
jgi:UDP-2,3-diacylglucosamine pyrophosphatase LpxH